VNGVSALSQTSRASDDDGKTADDGRTRTCGNESRRADDEETPPVNNTNPTDEHVTYESSRSRSAGESRSMAWCILFDEQRRKQRHLERTRTALTVGRHPCAQKWARIIIIIGALPSLMPRFNEIRLDGETDRLPSAVHSYSLSLHVDMCTRKKRHRQRVNGDDERGVIVDS
jgi:hypothetical protein